MFLEIAYKFITEDSYPKNNKEAKLEVTHVFKMVKLSKVLINKQDIVMVREAANKIHFFLKNCDVKFIDFMILERSSARLGSFIDEKEYSRIMCELTGRKPVKK